MHPRNLATNTKRKHAMNATKEFTWVLLVQKVQLDIVFESGKVVVIAWRASKITIDPKRKDVVNHMIGGGVCTKHLAWFLMESRVFMLPSFFSFDLRICSLCLLDFVAKQMCRVLGLF